MAEGTNVGNIYLDLVVRDTVDKQIQDMAAKGQKTAQKAFAGMEKTFESMANSITKQAAKPIEKFADTMAKSSKKMTDCFKKVSATPAEKALRKAQEQADKAAEKVKELENVIGKLNEAVDSRIAEDIKTFSESVEDAQRKVDYLAEQIVDVKSAMEKKPSQTLSQTLKMLIGQYHTAVEALKNEQAILSAQLEAARNNASSKFSAQQEKILAQLTAAKEKYTQITAQIASMESVPSRYDTGKEESVRKQMHAFEDAIRKDAEELIKNEEKAANRRRGILASMWKNMLSHAGSSAKSISGRITGIIKHFTTAGKATKRFGTRLREIVRGALIFNGISAALRSMVSYMGDAVSSSDSMKQALANLKGAAANAASPLI